MSSPLIPLPRSGDLSAPTVPQARDTLSATQSTSVPTQICLRDGVPMAEAVVSDAGNAGATNLNENASYDLSPASWLNGDTFSLVPFHEADTYGFGGHCEGDARELGLYEEELGAEAPYPGLDASDVDSFLLENGMSVRDLHEPQIPSDDVLANSSHENDAPNPTGLSYSIAGTSAVAGLHGAEPAFEHPAQLQPVTGSASSLPMNDAHYGQHNAVDHPPNEIFSAFNVGTQPFANAYPDLNVSVVKAWLQQLVSTNMHGIQPPSHYALAIAGAWTPSPATQGYPGQTNPGPGPLLQLQKFIAEYFRNGAETGFTPRMNQELLATGVVPDDFQDANRGEMGSDPGASLAPMDQGASQNVYNRNDNSEASAAGPGSILSVGESITQSLPVGETQRQSVSSGIGRPDADDENVGANAEPDASSALGAPEDVLQPSAAINTGKKVVQEAEKDSHPDKETPVSPSITAKDDSDDAGKNPVLAGEEASDAVGVPDVQQGDNDVANPKEPASTINGAEPADVSSSDGDDQPITSSEAAVSNAAKGARQPENHARADEIDSLPESPNATAEHEDAETPIAGSSSTDTTAIVPRPVAGVKRKSADNESESEEGSVLPAPKRANNGQREMVTKAQALLGVDAARKKVITCATCVGMCKKDTDLVIRYGRTQEMKTHQKSHSPDRELLTCPRCGPNGPTFTKKSSLDRHLDNQNIQHGPRN